MAARLEADLSGAVVRWAPHDTGIVNAIRRELALGRVLAGQRLPPVAAIAERFGVNEILIDRVLMQLHDAGMLDATPSGELLLRDPPSDRTLLKAELQSDPFGLVRFTEYRAVLEAGAAGLAAHRRTPEDLAEMAEAQRQLTEAQDPVASRNADTMFHLAVAHASDNEPLIEAIEDARMEVVGSLDLMKMGFIKVASYHGHEVILRAIRAGNSHDASEAMRLHIDTSRQEFQRRLDAGDVELSRSGG